MYKDLQARSNEAVSEIPTFYPAEVGAAVAQSRSAKHGKSMYQQTVRGESQFAKSAQVKERKEDRVNDMNLSRCGKADVN